MITIYTSVDLLDQIQNLIETEDRLNELVNFSDKICDQTSIKVNATTIEIFPDWDNTQPPLLFPTLQFDNKILLGIIYTKLNNFEKAYSLFKDNTEILNIIDLLNRLQNGVIIDFSLFSGDDNITLHNRAVAMQYGTCESQFAIEDIIDTYCKAIKNNDNLNHSLYTNYLLSQLYIDILDMNKAQELINSILSKNVTKKIEFACKDLLSKIWISQISIPYDQIFLEKIKNILWECLEYFESENKEVESAMILLDAGYVATISNSFSEALGYINRAILIFTKEKLDSLIAQANLIKGNLLQTWGQNGNPQFFRSAVKAYQDALRVFTKENTPHIFAEIQHQLGKVYAEIPDEVKKKGVWAAVSVSSFNEALNFYNKVDFPYEFAMICQSFGNAYTKYPASLHTDNYDKALAWYREALDIRTVQKYPIERVLSLSNYLEASWFVGNKDDFDQVRFDDMMNIANEILTISNDPDIIENTKADIEKLMILKAKFA